MKKLSTKNYAGYMAGDLANNLAFSMQGMFLMLYYTVVVGLNPAAIGTMFFVVRFYDAFADLFAGRMVDITRSRWGKFRPWLLFASLPLLLSSVLLFTVPESFSMSMKYVYAWLTYMLLGTLYSLVNIPYGSLATSMTQDTIERSKLGVWRGVGPILGTLLLVLIVSPQIKKYATDPHGLQGSLTKITLLFVVIGFLLYLVTFFTCKEQIHHEKKPITFAETVKVVKVNKPLLILCISNLIFLTGVFSVQASQAFYAQFVLKDATALVSMVVLSSIGSLLAVPAVPACVNAMGKKKTFIVGACFMMALGVWIFFMPTNKTVVMATFCLWGFVQNLIMSLLFAFEADAVDYGEWKTGERTEGAVYAVYSFFRKMSQALAGSVQGWVLAAGAFAGKGAKVQPESAITAIKALMGLAPVVFGIVGLLIFVTYPLTDEKVRSMVAEMRAREAVKA
ncbi:glycoside-pentoside-hexuronide (GPH):cation symporter [Luteococcus sp. H138]|uniref:glycoside-pentoside-hexuronide (GPH):cation symporter n=1 Tax=unclassified Luteococcus TaxID=2639923 RepID=UPI00313C4E8A